jgi:hypothetical protein
LSIYSLQVFITPLYSVGQKIVKSIVQ